LHDQNSTNLAALVKAHPDAAAGCSVMRRLLNAYAHGHHLSDEVEARELGRLTLKALVLNTSSNGSKASWLTKVVRKDGDIDTGWCLFTIPYHPISRPIHTSDILTSVYLICAVPISDSLYDQSLAPPRGIYQWAPMSYPPHIATLPKSETYGETVMFGALGLYLRLMIPKPSVANHSLFIASPLITPVFYVIVAWRALYSY
jgi:hypothetical protein